MHLPATHRVAGVSTVAVILAVCVLHYTWAVLLLASPVAAHSTPVSIVVTVFGGRYGAAAALITVALLAQAAPVVPAAYLPVALVPQQVLLLMSAGAGLYAAAAGHYADGVQRGWPFILGDQAPMILVAALYTLALVSAGRWAE